MSTTLALCKGILVERPDFACWQLTEPSLGYQGPFTYLLGALTAMDRK